MERVSLSDVDDEVFDWGCGRSKLMLIDRIRVNDLGEDVFDRCRECPEFSLVECKFVGDLADAAFLLDDRILLGDIGATALAGCSRLMSMERVFLEDADDVACDWRRECPEFSLEGVLLLEDLRNSVFACRCEFFLVSRFGTLSPAVS